jgi:predicted DNA-binding protein (UPF0251 family)
MTDSELANALIGKHFHDKTRQALRLVFVEGKSQTDAANIVGLHRSAVWRAVKQIRGMV